MSISEKMVGSLQENLVTLLAYSDDHGRVAAGMVPADAYEGDLRIIAEKCLAYWRQHGEAPKLHTTDLFSSILEDKRNRKAGTFKALLRAMHEMAKGINGKYVLDQAHLFVRQQRIKDAIFRSAEILSQPEPTGVEEVENILHEILKARDFKFDPGIRLHEWEKVIEYMTQHYDEFDTGIPEFDRQYIVPNRGALLVLLGEYGSGKTWACVHLGKRAMMRRKKVLHISTEVSAEEVMLRYYMSLFSVPKHSAPDNRVLVPTIETDDDDDGKRKIITGFGQRRIKPDFAFDWDDIRTEMYRHVEVMFGQRFKNLVVKRVPPRAMTTNMLRSYMDSLEQSEGFVPDMLIVDSGYLLKMDTKDFRLSLGRSIEDLRAIAVERNIAVIDTHQLNRIERRVSVRESNRAGSQNTAEDISIAWTADIVLVQDSTEAERQLGLARLYADKVRHDKGGIGVVMTQAYEVGQYVLNTVPLNQTYFEAINVRDAEDDGEEEGN